ncbi:MAG: tetratricopeptide repeat protein, partial [Alphaproteobacteria bacterium]|nr:tetratricopeptide repeat protein [Alphaproteobacteria bacterium]
MIAHRVVAPLALASILLGCGPEGQPIASGEAAATRLAVAQQAFIPPPRSVADVIEKLDREIAARQPDGAAAQTDDPAPEGEASVAAPAGATGSSQPPPSDAQAGDVLRRANETRARAQRLLREGRINEHVVAVREALDLAEQAGHRNLAGFTGEAAQAEFDFGSRPRATELRVLAVDRAVRNGPATALSFAAEATRVLAVSGRIDEARAMLRRAEGFQLQAGTPRNAVSWIPSYAYWIDLARGYVERAAGNPRGAETAWKSAVANAETMHARVRAGLGNNRDRFVNPIAFSLGQVTNVLVDQTRFVEAEVFARRSLQTVLEHFGPYHPTTIFRIESLTNVLADQGRLAESGQLASRALDIQRAMGFPPTSPTTLNARSQIASALLWRGKYDEALAQYRETLQAIGDNPALADRVTGSRNYGVALLMTGDARAAQPALDRAARDLTARLGAMSYNAAVLRGFRALAVARNGDVARAVAELRELAPVLEKGPA